MRYRLLAVFLAGMVLTGCTVGPNYHRPLVKTPDNFRAPEPLPAPQATSLADVKWWEVFKDDKLQDLIRAALAALQKPAEEIRARHGPRRKAAALRIPPDPRQRGKSITNRFPETSRNNSQLRIGTPQPF